MRKRLLIFWLVILTGTLVFPASFVQAVDYNAQINELRQKRETLSRDIQRNKEQIEKQKQEVKSINQELQKIEGDISVTEGKIAELQSQMDEVKSQIETKIKEIRQKEQELEEQKNNQDKALKTLYETSDQSLLYVLFSSNNISEVIDRTSYLEALEARIDQAIKTITQIKEELTVQKEALKKKQDELTSLKKQQEAYKKGLEYQQGRKQDLLYDAKALQARYEKMLEEAKKAYQDTNSELYRVMEAARKRAQQGKSRQVGNIEFAWPFSGPITAGFGVQTSFQQFHTGIDIDGIIGDPIAAAADGTVTFKGGSGNYSYGYYIKIDHGNGVSSLYGHLDDFEVSEGDEVKRGQRIGFMGNTGWVTPGLNGDGSHLHFEIREDGTPVNPTLYLP